MAKFTYYNNYVCTGQEKQLGAGYLTVSLCSIIMVEFLFPPLQGA